MTAQELIESGNLEYYVYGTLSIEEMAETEAAIEKFPEVRKEIEEIERALLNLAEATAPTLSAIVWTHILNSIRKVRNLNTDQNSTNWAAITGWAAAILFIGGLFWMLQKNSGLREDLQITTIENNKLQEANESLLVSNDTIQSHLASSNEILKIVRSKDYVTYTLPGNQALAPNAYAKVYYNKNEKVAYIDTNGLPAAERNKVFQVWSLKMKPLTPTSLGLIAKETQIADGIYKFTDLPVTEAFGITMEPTGGSETPTMSQLYILGTI